MALSRVAYTAAPAQTVFNITFDVLSSDYVHVYLDTVELVQPTEFTVNAARTQVTLVTPATGGEYVLLKRQTPTDPIVDWQPGGAILDEDLDTLYTQLMHLVQERQDDSDESIKLAEDGSGQWDALGNRITNVADGVDDQDAVTKLQLDGAQMQAGNLPVVTGADNDKFIQVKAGAWVTRTPAQVEADIGVDTLQSQMATAQADINAAEADIVTLEAGQPLARAIITDSVIQNNGTATWFETAGSRLALTAFDITRTNGTPHFTQTADKITIAQPGTYLVSLSFYVNLNSGSTSAVLAFRVTDDTNGGAQVLRYAGETRAMLAEEANYQYAEFQVVVSTTMDLVVRADLDGVAPLGSVRGLPSYIKIERMFTP